jgi:hypothetical protein
LGTCPASFFQRSLRSVSLRQASTAVRKSLDVIGACPMCLLLASCLRCSGRSADGERRCDASRTDAGKRTHERSFIISLFGDVFSVICMDSYPFFYYVLFTVFL